MKNILVGLSVSVSLTTSVLLTLLTPQKALAGHCADLQVVSAIMERLQFSTPSLTLDEMFAGDKIYNLQNIAIFSTVDLPYDRYMKRVEQYKVEGRTPSDKVKNLGWFIKDLSKECEFRNDK
jgi:hypothetical protein